jgi:hypothetical protein
MIDLDRIASLRERGIVGTTWDRLKEGVKLKSENKPRQGEKAGA